MDNSVKVSIRVRPLNDKEIANKHEFDWIIASNGRTLTQKSIPQSNLYTFGTVFDISQHSTKT